MISIIIIGATQLKVLNLIRTTKNFPSFLCQTLEFWKHHKFPRVNLRIRQFLSSLKCVLNLWKSLWHAFVKAFQPSLLFFETLQSFVLQGGNKTFQTKNWQLNFWKAAGFQEVKCKVLTLAPRITSIITRLAFETRSGACQTLPICLIDC